MKKVLTSLLALSLTVTVALGQHSSNAYRDLADSLYKHHHYQFAANYYEKALKKSENPGYLMLQLGKCYDKVNKPLVAEQWFRMAVKKRASFTDLDYYTYAETLIVQQKYKRADSLLTHVVAEHPEMAMARMALDDLRHPDRYYADSALVKIAPLPINTDVAEFSPARFRDGLVFTSARQEGALKKKYHWDNSHFLNLYYVRKTDEGFSSAELFEKDLNTKHHDGPAAFYDNDRRMIVNRNQRVPVAGREEVFEWRPGLYDAVFDSKKSDWEVTILPFSNPEYSFAHPAVSDDGNTLYFSSDMPGGYGGMDIYRATRSNGVWGTPFNLGPMVNTVDNEVFPFFISNTLYFSSNGRGGLGGLDIFISTQGVNGFAPPVNAGYPINSFADDLSFLTDSLQREGYFASARNGNDDIFSFRRLSPPTPTVDSLPLQMLLAGRVFRADNQQPVTGADVRVLTFAVDDQHLTSGDDGIVDFRIAEGQAYVVIASRDGLSGMHSGLAENGQQKDSVIHPIPLYSHRLNDVVAMGLVNNTKGDAIDNFKATITKKNTGKSIDVQTHPGLLTYLGERGVTYEVKVEHSEYETLHADVSLPADGPDVYRFALVMREKAAQKDNIIAPLVATITPATLLLLDTEDGKSKAFIATDNQVNEVKEKDGELTVQQGRDNKRLGKGTLADLRTDPKKILAEQGLSNVSPMLLRTVYFDFDKYNLDDDDIDRLTDVRNVLKSEPGYQLTISGHADDRGNDNYNERLSGRRAFAVARYLIGEGIEKSRIVMKAYGESRPAIPCMSGDCSERDHRMNRRAEFLLQGGDGTELNSAPDEHRKVAPTVSRPGNTGSMQTLLREYGNKSVEGISFRVNIGAYRKKHDLTFPELAGIGTVVSVNRNGVMYYYLSAFETLAEAEQARQKAVAKGIADASISVFRNGDRIQVEEFAALVQ